MMSLRGWVVLVLTGILAGCVSYQPEYERNLTLRLHQDIQVETNRARVFLQDGKVVHTNRLQTYGPSCDFEVREVSRPGQEQIIQADDFQVTRVYYAPPDYIGINYEPYQQYAHEGIEYPNTTYLTEFRLSSVNQPDVIRLNCKIWSIDVWQKYLSPEQINHTLGKIATLISE